MAYLVEITARAERDFVILYETVGAGASGAARRWYSGFREAILSLEELPFR